MLVVAGVTSICSPGGDFNKVLKSAVAHSGPRLQRDLLMDGRVQKTPPQA